MADIFQEIDEELRQDKAKQWWSLYGKYVIAAAVVIIAATAGFNWYISHQQAQREALAEQFAGAVNLVEAGDLEGAGAAFDTLGAQAGDAGIGMVARFQSAGIMIETGRHGEAAAALRELASDTTIPERYRALAGVMAVPQAEKAGEDAVALLEEITPMTLETAPWRHTARMTAASLALSAGNQEGAIGFLTDLAQDAQTPAQAQAVAREVLAALGYEPETAASTQTEEEDPS